MKEPVNILERKLAIVEEDMIKKDELNRQLKQIQKENKLV